MKLEALIFFALVSIMQHSTCSGRVPTRVDVVPLGVHPYSNPFLIFDYKPICENILTAHEIVPTAVQVGKAINRGDLWVNFTVETRHGSVWKQVDSQYKVDFCLTDTESDMDGSVIWILRSILELGQQCPIVVGQKVPKTSKFSVGNVYIPYRLYDVFTYYTTIYTSAGEIVLKQALDIKMSL